jgi:succinoglycan biosynthesis protein ExoA
MTRVSVWQAAPPQLATEPSRMPPFISVLVPVRNEESFIKETLNQLLSQNYDPARYEVIVADGQSTDATCEIVREFQLDHPNLFLHGNPRQWSSAGRNVAARASRGDILVVVDGHCDLRNPNYLADLAAAFAVSGADCIGRPQPLDGARASVLQQAIAAARSSRLGHHPDSFIYSSAERFVPPQSVAVAYRRHVFETVGLFDESFDACEDVEFNHRVDRAGMSCYFTPKVGVNYHARASLSGLFRQMVRYGRGRVRLLRKHPETFSVSCFLPAAFFMGLVAGAITSLFSSWLAAAYATVLGLYALVVLLGSTVAALQARNLRLLHWLPLVFPAIHLGAGVGILQEWFAGRPRVPWTEPLPLPARLQEGETAWRRVA